MIFCDECNTKLLTSFEDKERGYIWCRKCGLCFDNHPMGSGISGLMQWLKFYDATKSDMRKITGIYIATNLRDARIAAMNLIEDR